MTVKDRIYGLVYTTEAVGPYSYTDAGGEQTVYESALATRRKISFHMDLNTMTQNGTVRIYEKVDGANYRLAVEYNFVAADDEKVWFVDEYVTNQNFKVTYEEAVDEGAARSIPYNAITEVKE
jgi:hypothetical protein